MPYVDSTRGKVYYNVIGDGPPLLMLHGLSRSSRHWEGFDKQLAQNFKVITVDSPGIGRSHGNLGWKDSTTYLAEEASFVLKHLGIERAHLFGMSLGGMVALTFGLNHPHLTESLIVANTSTSGLNTLRVYPQAIGAMAIGAVIPRFLHPIMVHMCTCPETSKPQKQGFIDKWKSIDEEEGVRYLSTIKQLLIATKFRKGIGLGQLSKPTLIVYGQKDRFVPPANSHALFNLLPKAELKPILGTGHEIIIEKPRELADSIVSFVDGLERQ
ncbi:MAG: alpha/beta hydrolase [Oligoflexales bacterium]|nr:alpha/beta hydrolase [Oligoflexales bacterium]